MVVGGVQWLVMMRVNAGCSSGGDDSGSEYMLEAVMVVMMVVAGSRLPHLGGWVEDTNMVRGGAGGTHM